MITEKQLKDKIRKMADGNCQKAQILLRNYFMECFLTRISKSKYSDNFILKGGMLVAALVGLNMRATMDIDTTIRNLPLTITEAEKCIKDIISIDLQDNVSFTIKSSSEIMEEHDYTGVRFMLLAQLEKIKQPIKIDISTGDIITPSAINYPYKLMFDENYIAIYTYNIETLLAEKLETIIARNTLNTRLRDFYDIYTIINIKDTKIDLLNLKNAFWATSKKRKTDSLIPNISTILDSIKESNELQNLWTNYCSKNFYVDNLSWDVVISEIINLFNKILNC